MTSSPRSYNWPTYIRLMVNLGTWNVVGRDKFEVDADPLELTCNWDPSTILIGEGCETGFIDEKMLESVIIWLQQPELKNQELPEVKDIAVLDEDKTCLRSATSSLRETCGAESPGLHDFVTVATLISLEDWEWDTLGWRHWIWCMLQSPR